MEIQYLKKLRDNPTLRINNSEYLVSNSPISEQDIGQLEQLYNNYERIVQMGMAANKIAFEKYHCNSIADKTIDFYKKILAE